MKKLLATAAIAAVLAGSVNVASAQQIVPLDTTASSQLPVLDEIPPGAIVILGFVFLGALLIGIAGDGT